MLALSEDDNNRKLSAPEKITAEIIPFPGAFALTGHDASFEVKRGQPPIKTDWQPAAPGQAEQLAIKLDGFKTNDDWYRCHCPGPNHLHGDQNASLGLKDGAKGVILSCFAGCKPEQIKRALAEKGLWQEAPPVPQTWVSPVPPEAPSPSTVKIPKELAAPDVAACSFLFSTAEGAVSFYDCRFDTAPGQKEHRPVSLWRLGQNLLWRLKAPPKPWTLYHLELLRERPDAPLLICEGCKKADAAGQTFAEYLCLAPLNGAESPQNSDWSPVRGRAVIIWPDHDAAGQTFAAKVAGLCQKAGASSVRIVEVPPSFEPKWDLADPLPAGVEPALLQELLQTAVEASSFVIPATARGEDGRTLIRCGPRNIEAMCQAAEAALLASGRVYQRLGKIVDMGWSKGKSHDGKDVSFLAIQERTDYALQRDLARVVDFEKFDGRKDDWVPCVPPLSLGHMLKEEGRSRLPVLRGITNTPLLRADGTLLSQPGYDAATGLIFEPLGMVFPEIPAQPHKDDAYRALDFLLGIIKDFPFDGQVGKSNASRSVALSFFFTALIRKNLASAPAHAFDAPHAGTGKSKLVDIGHVLAFGHRAAVDNWTRKEEENEKLLGAIALAGCQSLALDNIEWEVSGGLLCKILTQQQIGVRVFGKLERPITDTNMLVSLTGNNLVFRGDITRRVLKGRLDAQLEQPETRAFDRDPVAYTLANRARGVVAVLTILRAYQVTPEKVARLVPYGDYDDWSALVRAPLLWLGQPDPVETVKIIRSEDPARETLTTLLREWHAALGSTVYSTNDVIRAAEVTATAGSFTRRFPALYEALANVCRRDGQLSAGPLGQWLGLKKNKVSENLTLCKMTLTEGKWCVKQVQERSIL